MANTILTHDMLAQRLLIDLKNQLTFSMKVYRGYRDEYHAVGNFKKGSTVRIELPNRYRAKDGATLDLVDTYETSTTVVVDTQKHVALTFTGQELTLDIEAFSRKHLVPAAIALANKVDNDGLAMYTGIYNQMGTPGTTPSTYKALTDCAERLDNESIISEGRVGVLSPGATWSMADGELKSVFDQQNVRKLTEKGFQGSTYAGIDLYMDQNVATHTVGNHGGSPNVATAPSEGDTSIALQGFNAGDTLLTGDVFTIASVAGVNPVSGDAWENNQLRQFVVTADATADGSGDVTVSISPTIYSSAAGETYLPYQTVNDLPAVGDEVTVVGAANGAYAQNLIFRPEAFALTMVPFERPRSAGQSVAWAQATDEDIGLSITLTDSWDATNYRNITRADILYGWDVIQPEYAVRLTG